MKRVVLGRQRERVQVATRGLEYRQTYDAWRDCSQEAQHWPEDVVQEAVEAVHQFAVMTATAGSYWRQSTHTAV